jgi:hypothetical protein
MTDIVDVRTMQNGVTEYSTAIGCGPIAVQRRLRSLYDEEVILYIRTSEQCVAAGIGKATVMAIIRELATEVCVREMRKHRRI